MRPRLGIAIVPLVAFALAFTVSGVASSGDSDPVKATTPAPRIQLAGVDALPKLAEDPELVRKRARARRAARRARAQRARRRAAARRRALEIAAAERAPARKPAAPEPEPVEPVAPVAEPVPVPTPAPAPKPKQPAPPPPETFDDSG